MRKINMALAVLLVLAGAALVGYLCCRGGTNDTGEIRAKDSRRSPPAEPITPPGPNGRAQSKTGEAP